MKDKHELVAITEIDAEERTSVPHAEGGEV